MTTLFSLFSPQQWKVLQALDRYRFLTVDQMLYLGIAQNPKSLRDKTLFALRHHKYICSEKIGAFLPDIHHLTPLGWRVLTEVEGPSLLPPPSAKKQPFSALFAGHRFAQVDFHMAMVKWVEQRGDLDLIIERQDFVRHPHPLTELKLTAPSQHSSLDSNCKTTAKLWGSAKGKTTLIPDGTFGVTNADGQAAVFVVEIHRCTQARSVADQLIRYFDVISQEAVRHKYDLFVHPIICSVHFNPAVLRSVKQRLLAHPAFAQYRQNFVFRELTHGGKALRDDFINGWHFADDTKTNPFPQS